jgi:cytolysin (calcineurin-like family phosphatase)
MENFKSVATVLNNIAAQNLADAIDKDQWEKLQWPTFYTRSV